MNKNNLIWVTPFMTALFVYVCSYAMSASASSNAKGKWNISAAQLSKESADKIDNKRIDEDSLEPEKPNTDNPITATDDLIADTKSSDTTLMISSDSDLNEEELQQSIQTDADTDIQGRTQEQIDQKLSKEQVEENALIEARLLLENINRQYKQLQLTLETEDSYSSKLGEDYFGYGLLLRQANRNDEAIEAFINALHIDKINNGIYSSSQKATLKALFDVYYYLNDAEEFEDYLDRILWIESKQPESRDRDSYSLLIKVSNYHLNKFLSRPIAGHSSVQTLLRAKNHLISAIKYHGDKPINELLMPYGELALISYLEGRMQPDLDKTTLLSDNRIKNSNNFDIQKRLLATYIEDPFPAGESVLMEYLTKAKQEKNQVHELKALIALGDLNLLFGRHDGAHENYNLAWKAAESSGQKQVFRNEFTKTTVLPNFHFASNLKLIAPSRPTVLVPLTINISENGRVRKVEKLAKDHEFAEYFSKARRVVRKTTFRPNYSEEGAALASMINYKVRVNDRTAIVNEQ